MARADGSVAIQVLMEVDQAEKDLAKLKKDIEKAEKAVSSGEAKKSPLVAQAEELRSKMKEARAAVERYRQEWASGVVGADKNEAAAQKNLEETQMQLDKVTAKIDKIDDKLIPAYQQLEKMTNEAGGLAKKINSVDSATLAMAKAQAKAEKSLKRFGVRLSSVVRGALVFTLITQALSAFRNWMGKVIKTNDKASAAMARLKGALLTMVQPLVEIIIPAFIVLVDVLTAVVSTLAQLFSMLTGKSVESSKEAAEALNDQTSALDKTGKAAKKATGALASFDEINKLSSGADADESKDIAPDFSFESNLSTEQLETILGYVTAIGVGFLSWKIGDALELGLGKTALLAGSAYLAFQLLSEGFKSVNENGWNLENTLQVIGGLLAGGLGISVLVGSLVPLLIAAIASVALAFLVANGEIDNAVDGAKKIFEGFVDFFTGIFTGDIEKAVSGIGKIFNGFEQIVFAVIDSISESFNSFLDWLDEKTGGKISGFIENVRKSFTDGVETLKVFLSGTVEAAKEILGGLVLFVTGVFTNDWDKAWQGVKDIFRGIINGIITIAEAMVNAVIDGINAGVRSFNSLLAIGDSVSEKIFGKTIRVNELAKVSLPRVPHLATGAVVPPNREFMAVLGDNKTEEEVVSPLSTMKQAMVEALRESGGTVGKGTTIVFEGELAALARILRPYIEEEGKRVGVSIVTK